MTTQTPDALGSVATPGGQRMPWVSEAGVNVTIGRPEHGADETGQN
jgi:hypothetical protein